MSETVSRTEAPRAARSAGLDLVRACAIALVVVGHGGFFFATWVGLHEPDLLAASGFFGVELFFVLSGFLIGRLLIRIIATRPTKRAWLVFMTRRWMRTLPIYFLWIGVLAVYWPPHFWEPGHWPLLWHVLPRFLTLTQNLAWPMTDDWFGVSWSLTVEEWFYLGFSALLLAAVVPVGRTAGFWTTALLFLTVPLALRWRVPVEADFNELLGQIAVQRLDAIAFGVVLAWVLARGTVAPWARGAALAAGLLLILALWSGWLAHHAGLGERAWRAIVFDLASFGFALCLPAAAALRRLPGIFGTVVRAISTQSYAIYIVHMSIFEFVSHYIVVAHLPVAMAMLLAPALIWGLSWASWRWIEAPILAHRPIQPDPDSPDDAYVSLRKSFHVRDAATPQYIAGRASDQEAGATQGWKQPVP